MEQALDAKRLEWGGCWGSAEQISAGATAALRDGMRERRRRECLIPFAIDLAKKYYESRHSGLDPESSSQPVNTTFRMPLDTGFCR